MMAEGTKQANLSRSDCLQYLLGREFKLQPKDYCQQFPDWPGQVGLEMEMFVFATDQLPMAKPMSAGLGPSGFSGALKRIADRCGWELVYFPGDPQLIKQVVLDEGDLLTFEPGGQLEYSSKPYPCFKDAYFRSRNIREQLTNELASEGYEPRFLGIHPWQSPESIGLQMNKPRYLAMNEHFRRIGPFGARMMRQTCTIQVNLDFGDHEKALAERYLVANLMAPYATALFAATPIADQKTEPGVRSLRSQAWQKLDSSRTGFPDLSGVWEQRTARSCAEAYLDLVMGAQVIFTDNFQVPDHPATFADWMAQGIGGQFPTLANFEDHLSTIFPEVRPRGFLEIRSVDGLPPCFQALPCLFFMGILYNESKVPEALDMLGGSIDRLDELWRACSFGLEDDGVFERASELAALAREGIDGLPGCYKNKQMLVAWEGYDKHFTKHRRTPADDLLEIYAETRTISDNQLTTIQERWKKLVR